MQNYVTIDNLGIALLFFCGVCYLYNTIASAGQNFKRGRKEATAPLQEVKDELEDHAERLDDNETRIGALERRQTKVEKQLELMLRAEMAMLSHELNGNSVDKLRDSMEDINNFLISKVP